MNLKWFFVFSFCVTLSILTGCNRFTNESVRLDRLPKIFPDYTSIVFPLNIAPLNFNIEEKASEYYVEIYSLKGGKISFRQLSSKILIPVDRWHNLLNKNLGNQLKLDIWVRQDKWYKYATITDTIAPETIDNHLVYRLIGAVYADTDKLGIYQRNLENFDNSAIFENTSTPEKPCMNCHTFSNNDPGKMSMHIRRAYAGTVIFDHGKLTKYNTKTEKTMAPAAYTAWHPNGEIIAYSLNRLFVYLTSNEDKLIEVCDQVSDIVLFNLKTKTISTTPEISSPCRETLPNWSPDGKWLYFIRAPKADKDMVSWVNAKYDLLRIPFNAVNMSWGKVDTLLTSQQTGMSITFPVASPDGRYILFCMIDHSYFSIFDKNSDLYLYDLKTNKYWKCDQINSHSNDSFHAWSKNGRWVVFSSKRLDDVSTRPFFAYFDRKGNFHKPFVLPQENPLFYEKERNNFNLPVLVDGKVGINVDEFTRFVTQQPVNVMYDNSMSIDTVLVDPCVKVNQL
jgi:hypothetical protein